MSIIRDEGTKQNLMNVREFAKCLGITTSCVRRWLLEGKIAKVKLGRLVRIPSEERERLIREGLQPARQTNFSRRSL
jgi:excisionase family DNA binding protein